MAKFVNSHKIVVQRNAFSNLQMRKMRTKSFGHGGLKCPFSQVEWDLDFKKRTNSPYNKENNKEEGGWNCDERGRWRKWRVKKYWANYEVLHLIAIWWEMELEFAKMWKIK